MKEADLGLVLKYFLSWYEFYLEQRHLKSVEIKPTEPDDYIVPVAHTCQDYLMPAKLTSNRMQQNWLPARQQDMAREVLLAEMFRRWRDAAARRRPPIWRLADPDVITDFVRRLRERIDDGGGRGNVPEPSCPADGGRHETLPAADPPQLYSQRDSPQQFHSQEGPPQAVTERSEGGAGVYRQTSSREPTAAGVEQPSRTSRTGRPSSAGTDSGDSVDLCAEIMTSHALKLAHRCPVPDTESEAELRRAPHLHSYLMNARSNRRARQPVVPAAAAAAGRPAYQLQLESRAELRRARQQEGRRRRQQREAAGREAERQRHEQFQQKVALERQQQQEQLRERRRRQEELRRRQLRGRQVLQQREALADGLRRRALVRRVFRALVRHVQRSRQLVSAADQWARSTLLQRCLRRWRHQRALVAAEREEEARHWRDTRLAARALNRWRTYVHQQRLKEQAASDLGQLQRLQAALRTWQASLALRRVRRRQQMHLAAQCDVRLTCAGALRRWRRLHDALEQERAVEARKDRLRRIVREMLPDFQPAAVLEPV